MKYMSILGIGLVLMFVATASAGVLDGHGDAFNDGNGPGAGGAWTGSVSFSDESLTGTLDFAVFTVDEFVANFVGLGYIPTSEPPTQLVYTYQVNNTGSDFLTAEIVGIMNPTNTAIGTFNIGDVDSAFELFDGSGNAVWQFSPPITTNQSSYGLAFSSTQIPVLGAGLALDGGNVGLQVGIPTPGPDPVPEPATILLLAVGGLFVLGVRRRLRR